MNQSQNLTNSKLRKMNHPPPTAIILMHSPLVCARDCISEGGYSFYEPNCKYPFRFAASLGVAENKYFGLLVWPQSEGTM